MNISEKLSVIQAEFKAKKSRYNSFGKYNFRSAEDILEALKPFNAKYKVYFTVTEEIVTTEPLPIIKSTNGNPSSIFSLIFSIRGLINFLMVDLISEKDNWTFSDQIAEIS